MTPKTPLNPVVEQPAQTIFKNDLMEWFGNFEPNQVLISHFGKGSCSIDQDTLEIVYEKTDLAYAGMDYCQLEGYETNTPGYDCQIYYQIDFSVDAPELTVGTYQCD